MNRDDRDERVFSLVWVGILSQLINHDAGRMGERFKHMFMTSNYALRHRSSALGHSAGMRLSKKGLVEGVNNSCKSLMTISMLGATERVCCCCCCYY
jgi:hypothetical protein